MTQEDQNARDISDIKRDMVRKDVYEAEKAGFARDIAEGQKDNIALEARFDKAEERRAADRRLIIASFVLPIISALVILYITSQIGAR